VNSDIDLKSLETLFSSGFIEGIKVETEGEGATWETIHKLLQLSNSTRIPLTVKIGGCDARTDIAECAKLGISNIVAPMIETKFAAKKFHDAIKTVTLDNGTFSSRLLVETFTGVKNIEEILKVAVGFASGVNVGRSDLAASLEQQSGSRVAQDDNEVLQMVEYVVKTAKRVGLDTTVGGRITNDSISSMQNQIGQDNHPKRVETRRLILNWQNLTSGIGNIDDVLKIERQIASWLASDSIKTSAMWSKYISELDARISPTEPKTNFP
jgi:2-keto-3-deoxy-L-rhamnonate aldolase RhmA